MRYSSLLHDCVGSVSGVAVSGDRYTLTAFAPQFVRPFACPIKRKAVLGEHGYDWIVKTIHAKQASPLQTVLGSVVTLWLSCA